MQRYTAVTDRISVSCTTLYTTQATCPYYILMQRREREREKEMRDREENKRRGRVGERQTTESLTHTDWKVGANVNSR